MINTILFGVAIIQIIGGLSIIFFDYNINIRGIDWGMSSFEGNIIQVILGILIIGYVLFNENKRKINR